MAQSKRTRTNKAPAKASQAQRPPKGQRSQNPRTIPAASFECYFCKDEKPLEEEMPGRKLRICTNCHENYTVIVSERAHEAALPHTASPLTSSPPSSSPPPRTTPLPQSPVRPATVIGPSKKNGSKEKTVRRRTAPKTKKPDAIVAPSKGPEKRVKLRLTAPKRPKPFIFLSLPGREKIALSFPNPLRRRKSLRIE